MQEQGLPPELRKRMRSFFLQNRQSVILENDKRIMGYLVLFITLGYKNGVPMLETTHGLGLRHPHGAQTACLFRRNFKENRSAADQVS